MPQKIQVTPIGLRPFRFHGLDLQILGSQAVAESCPFCGREGKKFYANIETGLWDCKSCSRTGNGLSFIKQLWEASDEATEDYDWLLADRGLINWDTLNAWGACQSVITNEWLLPAYSADGKFHQLYRYTRIHDPKHGWMTRLLPTPGIHPDGRVHGLFGTWKDKDEYQICEGPWDGMALWEVLKITKRDGADLSETTSDASSILTGMDVIATPGCNVFQAEWAPLFSGKRVNVFFDSDHLRENNGQKFSPGYEGLKRLTKILMSSENPPSLLRYHKWGDNGYDPDLPDGYDVRDLLRDTSADDLAARIPAVGVLFECLTQVPAEWLPGKGEVTGGAGGKSLDLIPCTSWRVLKEHWQKAMLWPRSEQGLDHALPFMLAVAASTMIQGPQLWGKVVGPASCGKTEMAEAMAVCKKYVHCEDTFSGYKSGWRQGDGTEDCSLLAKVKGKTFITKEGDTLLKAHNRDELLAEERATYDKAVRYHFKNGIAREHVNHCMTRLLLGTQSLYQLNSADLGERYLDCVVVEEIEYSSERAINSRIFQRMISNRGSEVNGHIATSDDLQLIKARQMTGGYVQHLREHICEELERLAIDEAIQDDLNAMAAFVEMLRARPSKSQDEAEGRAMSVRAMAQLTKLAMCLAVVLNKKSIDEEVMRRVRRVALDTARGKTLDIARYVASEPHDHGVDTQAITIYTGQTEEKGTNLIRFMARRTVGVLELFTYNPVPGVKGGRRRWRLTQNFREIWARVMGGVGVRG